MAKYPYSRVTNRVTITPVNDSPRTITEAQNFNLRQAWRGVTVPTRGTQSPSRSGAASQRISGSKVAGAKVLKGGQV